MVISLLIFPKRKVANVTSQTWISRCTQGQQVSDLPNVGRQGTVQVVESQHDTANV